MGVGVDKYRNMLAKLLPRGAAWDVQRDSWLSKLLYGMAEELARIESRGKDLLNEADPRTTFELLEDWERAMGLPDDCTEELGSIEERRQRIVAKLTMQGGQSIQFFTDLAASLGYEIEIVEYRPFCAGDYAGDRCFDDEWRNVFSVVSPISDTVRYFTAGSYAGERLTEFGNDILECKITQVKPAHMLALFEYV